ncbi:hypothetical protein BDW68DRAFT_182058 [Aspergillus falconensis]
MDYTNDNETESYLRTDLGGFSETTALSQRAINGAMKKLIFDHPDIGHVICHTFREDPLDAFINENVVLKVTGRSRDQLLYTSSFSSGELYFTIHALGAAPPPKKDREA